MQVSLLHFSGKVGVCVGYFLETSFFASSFFEAFPFRDLLRDRLFEARFGALGAVAARAAFFLALRDRLLDADRLGALGLDEVRAFLALRDRLLDLDRDRDLRGDLAFFAGTLAGSVLAFFLLRGALGLLAVRALRALRERDLDLLRDLLFELLLLADFGCLALRRLVDRDRRTAFLLEADFEREREAFFLARLAERDRDRLAFFLPLLADRDRERFLALRATLLDLLRDLPFLAVTFFLGLAALGFSGTTSGSTGAAAP